MVGIHAANCLSPCLCAVSSGAGRVDDSMYLCACAALSICVLVLELFLLSWLTEMAEDQEVTNYIFNFQPGL